MAAAATDKFRKLSRRWVGQIGAGGVSDASTTTIPLASATNLATDTGVTIVIDRVDVNGVSTPSLEETVVGVVSGSNIVSSLRGVEGTAQAHSAGAVVEVLVTSDGYNDMIDGILVEHSQLGVHDATIIAKLAGTQTFTGTKTFTGDVKLAGATDNIQVNSADPKRGIYIPAAALTPATTTGSSALTQYESTTNKVNYKSLDFDGATEEYAWLLAFQAPDYWDLSTITVRFHWTCASGSGDVIWGAAAVALSNDDALDTALGTAVTVTDTVLTALDVHTTANTSAITVGGTPAKGDLLFLRVYRDADAAGDTLNAVDARLIGITIKFGMAQYDDQ